ncbi:hypothetical protein VTN00DRAFT_1694 [Thermoascus crustaceus]|uniref:uncharacterized protein n=1 Tax=Thermoascus crustaceus TaxID=5088 RepID=UPI00374344AA
MEDQLKEIASEEAQHLRELAKDGAKSGAYLYPVKGLIYFLSHRNLWAPLKAQLGPTLSVGVGVTSAMFFFTYIPQAAVLTITSGPLIAPFSAALLVLSESSTITTTIARSFLLHDALTDTFDGTLVAQGHEALVADGRQIKPAHETGDGEDPIERLGTMLKRPLARFSMKEILREMLYLPLNFVPVVGTVLYVVVQGKRIGPVVHERYFQLKGWGRRRREEWVERNRAAYTSFGITAFIFEMVPFASLAFSFTNTIGAALWAADIERKGMSTELREEAKKMK